MKACINMDFRLVYWILFQLVILRRHSSLAKFSSFNDLRRALQSDTNNEFSTFPDRESRDNEPLGIETRLVITDVMPVREDSLEVIVHLQAVWLDGRVAFNTTQTKQNMTLIPTLQDKVWTPDTYLEPDWNGGNVDEQRVVRVFPAGAIAEGRRIRATIPCATEYVGIQRSDMICTTRIISYSYLEDEIVLNWDTKEPMVLKFGAVDTESQIQKVEHHRCEWDTLNDWGTSCLEVKLFVTKEFHSILFRVYLPSFMAVMMAWSSFWIHRDETSARIKLGTLVTWTVMTEYLSIELAFPRYLDNSAGNVWMLGCMIFTWISFFLYIIIHVVRRREKARLRREDEKEKEKDKEQKRTGERALSISTVHPEGRFNKRGVKGYSVWESKQKVKLSHIYISSFTLERWCRIWYGVVFFGFTALFLALFGRGLFVDDRH